MTHAVWKGLEKRRHPKTGKHTMRLRLPRSRRSSEQQKIWVLSFLGKKSGSALGYTYPEHLCSKRGIGKFGVRVAQRACLSICITMARWLRRHRTAIFGCSID